MRVTLSLLVLLTLSMSVGLSASSGADRAHLLLVGNKSDDTVSFVDVETRQTVGTTTTGRGPHELAVTPNGKLAFAANYEGSGDSISLIDVPARKELRRIMIAPYQRPHGLVVSPDGSKLYATCEASQALIELDVAAEKVTRAFPTAQNGSHMVALTPNGKRAYTANIGSGSSTPIDLVAGKAGAPIQTGPGCEGIDVSPDGKQVWTANNRDGTLSVIETATNTVAATLPCPGFPIRVKLTPNGKRALVSCPQANAVAVFDVETRRELKRIPTGTVPVGILIDPSGKRAWVANTAANKVSILDLEKLEVAGEIVAGKTPDGLALVR
jgi:YVTN family beta-propeller protein